MHEKHHCNFVQYLNPVCGQLLVRLGLNLVTNKNHVTIFDPPHAKYVSGESYVSAMLTESATHSYKLRFLDGERC